MALVVRRAAARAAAIHTGSKATSHRLCITLHTLAGYPEDRSESAGVFKLFLDGAFAKDYQGQMNTEQVRSAPRWARRERTCWLFRLAARSRLQLALRLALCP